MKIFVLLFNAGTDNEGIHTLSMGNKCTVLMFEQEDDATRYSLLLEAQDCPPLTVEEMDDTVIKEFCDGAGYSYKLVTSEELVIPPESNIPGYEAELETEPPRAQETEIDDDDLEALRKRFENLL